MAKARFRYNRIMPLEAAIFNLRLAVDKAPEPLVAEQGEVGQRAWAYLRDANGGNALSKLARYETSLLREYDRSRQELEKLRKIRAAGAPPSPTHDQSRREANLSLPSIESTKPAASASALVTQNPLPSAKSAARPDVPNRILSAALSAIPDNICA
jgi:hypothetical protein